MTMEKIELLKRFYDIETEKNKLYEKLMELGNDSSRVIVKLLKVMGSTTCPNCKVDLANELGSHEIGYARGMILYSCEPKTSEE